jgi:hypothetical protein
MRSSAPSSCAITVMPVAPPATMEKAPVTRLIPRRRAMSWPAARLSTSVETVTRTTGSQSCAMATRVSTWISVPTMTPMTTCTPVIAGCGTPTRRSTASARASPTARPAKSAGEGTPR